MKTLVHFMDYSTFYENTRTFYETLDILFDNIRAFHEMYECFRQTLDIFQKKVAALHPHFPPYRALSTGNRPSEEEFHKKMVL